MSLSPVRHLRAAAAFAVVLILVACETTDPVTSPPVSDSSTFLGLATRAVFEIDDEQEQAELFTSLASAYLEIDDPSSARSVANRALERSRSVGDGEESLRIRVDLVPIYSVVDPATAVSILEELLLILDERSDDVLRASFIPTLIANALDSGEPARFALREGVDLSYIILDPVARAQTLIEVASLYQQRGIGLSVTGLIQQSIPAIRSSPNVYRQAALFSQLAILAANAQELPLAARLVDMTSRALGGADAADSPIDRRLLSEAARRFASLRDRAAVVSIAERLPEGYHRFLVDVELALLIPSDTTRAARLQELEAAAAALGETVDRADAYIRLAEAFLESGIPDEARRIVSLAQGLVSTRADLQNSEERISRLIAARVAQDDIEQVTELMNAARDPYIRGIMAIAAADRLISDGRLQLAEDFLVVGLRASDETSFLADALREQLVRRFARTASIRLAIRTVERIDDPVFTARAVVSLAVIAEPAGLTTPIHRSDLASVLR